MPHYVGLDASKATTSICVVNEDGARVQEGAVETEPRAIIGFLRGQHRRYGRIGIEAMAITPRIYEALARAGLPIVCIENRHAHGVLTARTKKKTDRNDARGIAEMMRVGIFKPVHIKTQASQEAKVLLTARKFLVYKRKDIDNFVGAILLQAGLKLPRGSGPSFLKRVQPLIPKAGLLRETIDTMLEVRARLGMKIEQIEAKIAEVANADPICRRLLTAPGIGRLTALVYRTAVDVPERFSNSRNVGAHFGMTPGSRQTGRVERRGHITRCGDSAVRSALHLSARAILRSRTRPSALKTWGRRIVDQIGYWKAVVAVARKLAVILHRMWVTETDFEALPTT
jgi:transposase